MNQLQFSCDICGTKKGNNNHWFLAWLSDDAIVPQITTEITRNLAVPQSLVIAKWDEIAARQLEVTHLCGESCTLKMVQRWITTRSLYAPRTPAGDSV